jgi:hypothetical protein
LAEGVEGVTSVVDETSHSVYPHPNPTHLLQDMRLLLPT